MYIVKVPRQTVFDWITPIFSVADLMETVKNPAIKICVVQIEDAMEMWSCSSDKDAIYDLRRYYDLVHGIDLDHQMYYFFKIKPFTSRPVKE